jgi:NADH-quinone oxidoreductase subunit N
LDRLPEIILALGILALVLIGAYRGDRSQGFINACTLALIGVVALVLTQPAGRMVTFNGAFVVDAFARFMKIATLLASGVTLAMSFQYLREEKLQRFEYPDPHRALDAGHDVDDFGQ